MKFDFSRHSFCYGDEGDYEFFNCALCGLRWERCDRVYLVENQIAVGRCCPDCSLLLIQQGAKYEDWSTKTAGNA